MGYAGPHEADLPQGEAKIVVFGPGAASGRTGGGLGVIAIDSGQNWGKASTELVHALMEEHALALSRWIEIARILAEQLSLKTFVPVVALSDDKALTSTNVPWIFRLPADAGAAEAIRLVTEAARVSGDESGKGAGCAGVGNDGGGGAVSADGRAGELRKTKQ